MTDQPEKRTPSLRLHNAYVASIHLPNDFWEYVAEQREAKLPIDHALWLGLMMAQLLELTAELEHEYDFDRRSVMKGSPNPVPPQEGGYRPVPTPARKDKPKP